MDKPILPVRAYLLVFAGLILLTVATILLSQVELGNAHLPVGLLIATLKAVLVILVFMHVIHEGKLTWLVALGSVLWLVILLSLTLTDYANR